MGCLKLVGRFEGYKYFPTSLVETAFLVYQKAARKPASAGAVEVLVSQEGREDAALRALRLPSSESALITGADHFERPLRAFSTLTWRPLRERDYALKGRLQALRWPRVKDLFDIRQGIRRGHAAFRLTAEQYRALPTKERKYFRPAAGGRSIRQGQLHETEYVWYPYAPEGGPLLRSEQKLRAKVPHYCEEYLLHAKEPLMRRRGFGEENWWLLSERRAWQGRLAPRLVSANFGGSGSFAFDSRGDYVTVNGNAWFWARETVCSPGEEPTSFEDSQAVWAYLALLNSQVFERIVSLFSVRLQGGQLRLEKRFLSSIPMPDVTDESQVAPETAGELVRWGKAVHGGRLYESCDRLDRSVSRLYAIARE